MLTRPAYNEGCPGDFYRRERERAERGRGASFTSPSLSCGWWHIDETETRRIERQHNGLRCLGRSISDKIRERGTDERMRERRCEPRDACPIVMRETRLSSHHRVSLVEPCRSISSMLCACTHPVMRRGLTHFHLKRIKMRIFTHGARARAPALSRCSHSISVAQPAPHSSRRSLYVSLTRRLGARCS